MIIKRENKRNYTTINNEVVEDPDLSYEALGLLTYLLSRPENWEVHIEQLRVPHGVLRKGKRVKLGKDKIYAIVGELSLAGYMEHKRVYVHGKVESGYWIVREEPINTELNQEQNSTADQLDPGIPDEGPNLVPENLVPENLVPVKPDIYKRLKDTKDGKTPKDSRENARAHGQALTGEVRAKPRFEFLPPPEDQIRLTFEALAAAWQQGAKGGRGAIGNSNKARSAIADLPDADHEIAIERAPRFLRALKAASRHPLSIENYILGREFDHHPPPKGIDPAVVQPIELTPYSVSLWMMVWNAIDPVGKNHLPTDRVKYFLARIVKGLVTPASALPKADDDVARLIPVKIGSPDHAAWVSHCEKLGFRLPKPDAVPVVYVPTQTPPNLKSTWKGYRLALPQRLIFRSVIWWWRLHRIDEGAIIEAQLREAGSSQGAVMIDMGPWPSSVELAGMVQIVRLSDQFRAWARWFDTKGVFLDLWPESSIWCPGEYPPLQTERMKEKELNP